MEYIVLRLKPNQDLHDELEKVVSEKKLDAACLLTCVGSLTTANIRYANQENGTVSKGHFEIVSLTGVMSRHGSHYHISIANKLGEVIGGHLLSGCKIYTTAELVLGIVPEHVLLRTMDPNTGYPELDIRCSPNHSRSLK